MQACTNVVAVNADAASVALQRPSARVAANMLHLSLWGRKALANQDGVGMRRLVDWLLCRSALVLLKGPRGDTVEAELQTSFLSQLELEELRAAVGFLLYGREHRRACALVPQDRLAPSDGVGDATTDTTTI